MNRMRWNLVVAASLASAVVGCAQCDTCDDFPAPCRGPNCGQNFTPAAFTPPPMGQPGPVPMTIGDDMAEPAPAVPSPTMPPAAITPMDPATSY